MTTAIPDALVRRREGVPIWVIIVAVIAGVILLSLLIVCLWKVSLLQYTSSILTAVCGHICSCLVEQWLVMTFDLQLGRGCDSQLASYYVFTTRRHDCLRTEKPSLLY